VQDLVKSAAESNGAPGQGLSQYLELYTWTHSQLFNFLYRSENLQDQVSGGRTILGAVPVVLGTSLFALVASTSDNEVSVVAKVRMHLFQLAVFAD
jgi:hypothetical protein